MSYLPFDPQLGDHKPVIAEFTQESVLGFRLPQVVPSKACRLTSKVQRICQKYIDNLEGIFKKYKVLESLREIKEAATFPASREAKAALEKFDKEMLKLMLMAEKDCRQLYANHYNFSLDVKLWLNSH